MENLCKKLFSYSLKNKQRECLELLGARKHVCAALPTGFGKSTVIQLWPVLYDVVCVVYKLGPHAITRLRF